MRSGTELSQFLGIFLPTFEVPFLQRALMSFKMSTVVCILKASGIDIAYA